MISIFTPTNNPKYLQDCYDSLTSQTLQEWEWIIVYNNGAGVINFQDERVKEYFTGRLAGVGAAKKNACEKATGDILVELDHDDVLLPTALEKIQEAFNKHPGAVCVYSDFSQINENKTPNHDTFNESFGWKCRDEDGYLVYESFDPTPAAMGYIWFQPNHVRAFRKEAYVRAGGYNKDLVILDDQELMNKLYLQGEFIHIPELLYLQRVHPNQTQKKLNADIQTKTVEIYSRDIVSLCLAWSKRHNLLALDFGAFHRPTEGFQSVDMREGENVDIVTDLTKKFPWPDNSVGVIRAVDFLEHIEDKMHTIKEIHRVLAPGGMLLSMTPSTDGRGAFQDPTHVAYYNEHSFWYYCRKQYRDFVDGLQGVTFKESYLATEFISDWHKANNVPYVIANLVAIKDHTYIPGRGN